MTGLLQGGNPSPFNHALARTQSVKVFKRGRGFFHPHFTRKDNRRKLISEERLLFTIVQLTLRNYVYSII